MASNFRRAEIQDFNDLADFNLEHTDLENYNNSEINPKTSLFRNRPVPIVNQYNKNNDELGTEMKTEQMIEHTSIETANVTLTDIQTNGTATNSGNQTQISATTVDTSLEVSSSTRPSCMPKKLGEAHDYI